MQDCIFIFLTLIFCILKNLVAGCIWSEFLRSGFFVEFAWFIWSEVLIFVGFMNLAAVIIDELCSLRSLFELLSCRICWKIVFEIVKRSSFAYCYWIRICEFYWCNVHFFQIPGTCYIDSLAFLIENLLWILIVMKTLNLDRLFSIFSVW